METLAMNMLETGVVIPTSISDLVGVTDTEVPRFPEIIKSARRGQAVGYELENLIEEEVRKNIECLAKVIRYSGGAPLLVELAVINDPRMTPYLDETASSKPNPFFVSDIICFGDDEHGTDHLFLDAWHRAIQRLGDSKVHEFPQMIVPHPDTYSQGYVVQDFGVTASEAFELFGNQESTTDLLKDWPECKTGLLTDNSNFLTDSRSSACLTENRGCAFRKQYDFSLELKRTDLQIPIERLTRGFIFYVVQDIESRYSDRKARSAKIKEILTALSSFRILIVPFRRPHATKPENEPIAMAHPGGCLFVVFQNSIKPEMLELLSLRLSYVLSRAALAEAFSDIDLREQRSKALSVVTHALGTRAVIIRGTLAMLRSQLLDSSISEIDRRALGFAEQAASNIADIAKVARYFQKIKEGDMMPLILAASFNGNIREEIKRRITAIWSESKELAQKPAAVDPDISFDGLTAHTNSIQTDDRYLLIVLSEIFANILQHGIDVEKNPPRIAFRTTQWSTAGVVWIHVENYVTRIVDELRILRSRMMRADGKIGMSVLEYAAAAWGLPEPRFGLLNTSPEVFVTEVPLGLLTSAMVMASAS